MGLTEEGIKPPKLIKTLLMMTRKAYFAAVGGDVGAQHGPVVPWLLTF